MKKFKFQAPYKPNGKTNFPETKARSGVYLIKENNKIVYIGFSAGSLYKTMYRHFQRWSKPDQYRVSYRNRITRNNYTVRIVFCSAKQAEKLEKALIIKYKPRDNEMKYENYTLTFADNSAFKTYEETATLNTCPF